MDVIDGVSAAEGSTEETVVTVTTSTEVGPMAEAGRGQKKCPQCGAIVGVRLAKCECGHEFPKKAAGSTGQSKSGTLNLNNVTETLALVEEVRNVVGTLGGPEKAEETLNVVEGLVKRTGNFDGLRAVLAAVLPKKAVQPTEPETKPEPKVEDAKPEAEPETKPEPEVKAEPEKPRGGKKKTSEAA